jgi:hypothetical protein
VSYLRVTSLPKQVSEMQGLNEMHVPGCFRYVLKMWQMDMRFRKCGERQNTVGHRCYSTKKVGHPLKNSEEQNGHLFFTIVL